MSGLRLKALSLLWQGQRRGFETLPVGLVNVKLIKLLVRKLFVSSLETIVVIQM